MKIEGALICRGIQCMFRLFEQRINQKKGEHYALLL